METLMKMKSTDAAFHPRDVQGVFTATHDTAGGQSRAGPENRSSASSHWAPTGVHFSGSPGLPAAVPTSIVVTP
ncbi:hypothetical protein EYF80_054000 [Liparis tanakae]|uniref:Uncharacterized protein n=1 Tax=Liparis tanakae TaxID=230148 RepID=A0A4Z2F3V9_9TELE|nr:hypothetical protein EYF80_054000 [Liparis tanakae]